MGFTGRGQNLLKLFKLHLIENRIKLKQIVPIFKNSGII